jgi:hypothetical protein
MRGAKNMPAVTNVVEFVTQGTAQSTSGGLKNIFNVFHYRLVSGPLNVNQQLASDFYTKIMLEVTPQLAASYALPVVLVRLMDVYTFQYVGISVAGAGGKATQRLPNIVSAAVRFHCADRGREFRGGKHFGPLVEADVIGDELTGAAITAWQPVLLNLGADLSSQGGNWRPIVLSRKLSVNTPQQVTLQGSDINGVFLNKAVGTMRKRKEHVVG